jgi:hypothetical protein
LISTTLSDISRTTLCWVIHSIPKITSMLPNFMVMRCWGVTRKIRMTTLTRVRVLNTFKFKVRAQRDCDSLCK